MYSFQQAVAEVLKSPKKLRVTGLLGGLSNTRLHFDILFLKKEQKTRKDLIPTFH